MALFEGGYELEVSAECTEAVLREMIVTAAAEDKGAGGGGDGTAVPPLMKPPCDRQLSGGTLGEHTELLLRKVLGAQREFWQVLQREEHRYMNCYMNCYMTVT